MIIFGILSRFLILLVRLGSSEALQVQVAKKLFKTTEVWTETPERDQLIMEFIGSETTSDLVYIKASPSSLIFWFYHTKLEHIFIEKLKVKRYFSCLHEKKLIIFLNLIFRSCFFQLPFAITIHIWTAAVSSHPFMLWGEEENNFGFGWGSIEKTELLTYVTKYWLILCICIVVILKLWAVRIRCHSYSFWNYPISQEI